MWFLANDSLAGLFSPALDVLWAEEQRTKASLAGSKGLDLHTERQEQMGTGAPWDRGSQTHSLLPETRTAPHPCHGCSQNSAWAGSKVSSLASKAQALKWPNSAKSSHSALSLKVT